MAFATYSEKPSATAKPATPAIVTEFATQRGITLQKMPAMIAATSGASGMTSSRLGFRDSTRSAFQSAQVFDVDAAAFAEQHHQDREANGGFRRGHSQH